MRLLCLTFTLLIAFKTNAAFESRCLRDPSENIAAQVGLNEQFEKLITGRECDASAYTETPCECYAKESSFTKFTYNKDMKKDEKIQKRIEEMKEEKREKIYEKWIGTLNDTFQNMLYFDQLIKHNLISSNLLARVPNCSFGGMYEKITSAMKGECSESEFVTKLNKLDSKFNSNGKKYSNFQEYLKTKENDYKNLVDNNLHRENSCVPYQTFASANLMHSLSNEKIMGWQDFSFEYGNIRGLNSLAQARYEEVSRLSDEETFKASLRRSRPEWTEQRIDQEFQLHKNKKVFQYTLSKMNSKNPFLKLVSGNIDLYHRVSMAMSEDLDSSNKSTTDALLSNEKALAEIFDYQDEICESAFGGKMLVQTACGEIPITPTEMVNDKKIIRILKKEDSRKTPKTMLVRNFCERKKGKGKNNWHRIESAQDPMNNLIHHIDPLSETEDLLANDTKSEKSSYESFDEMYCKIFSKCDSRNGVTDDFNCNNPEYYLEELAHWTKENAGVSGEIDWKSLFSDNTNDYIEVLNGLALNNFNTEEQASFLLISKMILTQAGAINFSEEIENAKGKRHQLFSSMPEAYSMVASKPLDETVIDDGWGFGEPDDTYQMLSNFGVVALDEDNSALFTNYFVRSSTDDYQNMALASQNYDPSNDESFNINDSYNRRDDFNYSSQGTGYADSFVQSETKKVVNKIDNGHDSLLMMNYDNSSINPVASSIDSQRPITMTEKSSSSRIGENLFDSVVETDNTIEVASKSSIASKPRQVREKRAARETFYDDFVEEVAIPKKVQAMSIDDSVNYAQSADFLKNSKKLQNIRDQIASRQKEIDRLTSEINNGVDSKSTSSSRNTDRVAANSPEMRYPDRSMAAHPNWGDNPSSYRSSSVNNGSNTNFSSVASAPNANVRKASTTGSAENVKAVGQKGGASTSRVGRSIASVAHGKSGLGLELGSLLEQNGIEVDSRAAQAISSIENKLKNKKLTPIMFDDKGKRRKFISLDFAYPMGLKRLAVSTGEVGKKEIGFIRYIQDPYQPFLVFIVLKHKNDKDKLHNDPAYRLPLEKRVSYYETKAEFEKIDNMVDDYKLSRVVRIPFDAKKHDIKEIGYTYSEIFDKTVGSYDF